MSAYRNLYIVHITMEIPVLAGSPEEAMRDAQKQVYKRELDPYLSEFEAVKVIDPNHPIPHGFEPPATLSGGHNRTTWTSAVAASFSILTEDEPHEEDYSIWYGPASLP